jgi:hypothetical protein
MLLPILRVSLYSSSLLVHVLAIILLLLLYRLDRAASWLACLLL